MIQVHHLEYSRSQRILWLLEELNMPYEVKLYKRNPKTKLAPPELKAIHPLGKSPVITDQGLNFAESGAIIEYLLDRYDSEGKLRPVALSPERIRCNYWMHYAEGSLMPPLVMALVFRELGKARVPFFVKPILKGIVKKVNAMYLGPQMKLQFDFMEQELSKGPWFAGEKFTAADIQMSYPIEGGMSKDSFANQYPRLQAYIARVKERPAYQRAEAKVGDFGVPK